ncbi:restriction endonuclease subunit S [Streptococcus suis]|nr:restriction endonuclease subunit S [Streptococcus suis]
MEIFKFVSDKGYADLPILSASQELGMIRRDEIGIDIKYDKEAVANYKRVLPGQFVIHLRSFQGGFAWSEIEGLTSPAYTILDFKEENSSKFWRNVLTSPNFIKKLETVTYGIRDGRSISYSDFSTLNFVIPTLPEQEAIGSFFSDLDQLITLHQRKLDDVKELKKALLQKMFPKGNGNDFPELRFPEFTDAWKQRKAMEIFKFVSDKGYADLPILSASQELGMIRRDEIGIDIKYDKEAVANYKRVLPGQFVIHLRSFQGGFAWSEIEGLTSPAYTILDFKEENSSKFWRNVLTSPNFIKKLETVTYGIRDGRSISYSDFSTLNFVIPTLPEQEAIGSFFSDLDQLITLHQRK